MMSYVKNIRSTIFFSSHNRLFFWQSISLIGNPTLSRLSAKVRVMINTRKSESASTLVYEKAVGCQAYKRLLMDRRRELL